MELQSTSSETSNSSRLQRNGAPSKKERLTLEEYFNFLYSRQTLPLTVNHLNQIIRMHAFKKIHKVPKKVLTEAVSSLDLLDLPRSTLAQRSVSGFAFLNMDDINADLEHLNWQECCLTSIKTFGSYKQSDLSASAANWISPATAYNHLQLQPYSQKQSSESVALRTCGPIEMRGLPETSTLLQNPDAKIRKRAKKMKPIRRKTGSTPDCISSVDGVSLDSC